MDRIGGTRGRALLLLINLIAAAWWGSGVGLALDRRPHEAALFPPTTSVLVTLVGPGTWAQLDGASRSTLISDRVRSDAPDPVTTLAEEDSPAAALLAARSKARLLDAAVMKSQEPSIWAIEQSGASVVSRYSTSVNGLLVHATAAQMASIAGLPGIERIESAPRWRLGSTSLPAFGPATPHAAQRATERVAESGATHVDASSSGRRLAKTSPADLALDGTGSIVAIVDTGIDYTHADFGGPGTAAAYQSAVGASDVISDTFQGQALFPTAKVVGGYDFVGPNYTSPGGCPPDQAATKLCTTERHPDPDPLDQHGHGTHVAGIAAGSGSGSVPAGVAPAARLVALKIYGPPANGRTDEEVDVVVDAIEWCTRVNLGLSVPGTPPPNGAKIDVINMSLGEDYAQGSRLFDAAATAASEAGISVVASAGNAGDQPYILGAPGASTAILSVASADPATASVNGEPARVDIIAGYSSRGPSRNGALKPDVAAPGSSIQSAAMGSGNLPRALSGTSMASPHGAGSAALLAQRNRDEALGLDGASRSALLMNYAGGLVRRGPAESPALVPTVRQGSGRVDVALAVLGEVLMRPQGSPLASLQLGPLALVAKQTFTRTIEVQSLVDQQRLVQAGVLFVGSDDAKGLSVIVPNEPMTLPARGRIRFDVLFRVDPNELPQWLLEGNPISAPDAYDAQALEGRLQLRVVTANGQSIAGVPVASVTFSLLPRRASAIGAVYPARRRSDEASAVAVDLPNRGFAGLAELFMLPENAEAAGGTADDELPLAWSGVRYLVDNGDPWLSFGLASRQPWAIPQPVSTEVYLDRDLDGRADLRLRLASQTVLAGQTGTAASPMAIGLSAWDPSAGAWQVPERQLPAGEIDQHSRVLLFSVPLSALDMVADQAFDYYIVRRGVDENWLESKPFATTPDGADAMGGPRYRVRPQRWAWVPEAWSVLVPEGAEARVELHPKAGSAGSGLPRLLLIMPQGRLDTADGQARLLGGTTTPPTIYLPRAMKRYQTPR